MTNVTHACWMVVRAVCTACWVAPLWPAHGAALALPFFASASRKRSSLSWACTDCFPHLRRVLRSPVESTTPLLRGNYHRTRVWLYPRIDLPPYLQETHSGNRGRRAWSHARRSDGARRLIAELGQQEECAQSVERPDDGWPPAVPPLSYLQQMDHERVAYLGDVERSPMHTEQSPIVGQRDAKRRSHRWEHGPIIGPHHDL